MKNEMLSEIKELRAVIAKVVGTSNKPFAEQFSKEALDKAALEFRKLSIERGDWVEDSSINKVIKSAPWRAGKFIREHFKFNNYFQKGRTYYYNKKDLQALACELKERNVDLGRYIEFLEEETKYKNHIEKAKENKKHFQTPYQISKDTIDIISSPAKPPALDIIKADIKKLKKEFKQDRLNDYIDIYRDNHAMMKHIYFFDKYLASETRTRCNKWIKDFNYANTALEHARQNERKRRALITS